MKRVYRLLLIAALATLVPVFFAARTAKMQNRAENSSLKTAPNSLGATFANQKPVLQPGFENPQDMWLLYSREFDALSGSMQSYLLRKYGLVHSGVPRPDAAEGKQVVQQNRMDSATQTAAALTTEQAIANGENVRVNDPALDVRSRVQTQTSSASSGGNIVVVYNDAGFQSFGSSISYSTDGGSTWRQRFPSIYPGGIGLGDAVVAAGPDGVFYQATLAANFLGSSTVGVTRSENGGATWSPLANATASTTNPLVLHDRPALAVDTTNSQYRGNVYLSWTRFTQFGPSGPSGTAFARSTDGGRTWSQFLPVGRPSDFLGFAQGSAICVGADGEIYIAYYDTRVPGISVVKSTDGGQTFRPSVIAFRDPSVRPARSLASGFEIPPSPSIAVDTTDGPNRGTVYITNEVKPTEAALDDSDVILVKSTDGGTTWTDPVKVSDDRTDTDQFQSSLAVAPDGTLGLMWYDRRNDPLNNVLVDVYATTSADGGNTFTPNRRITSGNWLIVPTPPGIPQGDQGAYNRMSAGELGFVFNWADARSGTDPDVYATVLSVEEAKQPPPDELVISSQTTSRNIFAGTSANFTLLLSGAADEINLTASPSYPGLNYTVTRAGAEAQLTVEVAPGTTAQTYPIIVQGARGDDNVTRTTTLRLTVYNPAELRRVPRPISGIRDSVFQPKAVVDSRNNLHVAVAGRAEQSFTNFRELKYQQYRGDQQLVATTIVSLDDPNTFLDNQAVGVDDAGNITVVWRQIQSFPQTGSPAEATTVTTVFLSRSIDNGQTFSEPVNVSGTGLPGASANIALSPALAVSKSGTINVAYLISGVSGQPLDLLYTRSTDGGQTFSPRVNVTGGLFSTVATPVIALDSSEEIAIAYFGQSGANRGDIFVSRSTDGARFFLPVNVSRAGAPVQFPAPTLPVIVLSPSVAIDPAGNINVVFIRIDPFLSEESVYYARSTDKGVSFSAPKNVSSIPGVELPAFTPSVGTDSRGNIGISWTGRVQGRLFSFGNDVFFTESTDGGGNFSPVINITNNISQQAALPVVITDENGEVAVLLDDDTSGNNQLYVVTP